jgi:hypothetical protein
LASECETTKYMKLNKGKWDSRNETRKKVQNKTKFYFWRNKTKQNKTKFRCFYCFVKQAKFCETNFLFRFVLCFAKQKKDAKWKPYTDAEKRETTKYINLTKENEIHKTPDFRYK